MHSIFKQAKFGINFQHLLLFHDFSWDFINQTLKETYLEECLTVHQNCYAHAVPYSQKGSHFVDLWMVPVLFSGIALRLTLQLLNKSITTIQFQHLFLFLYGTVLKRIWCLGTGRN